MTYGCLRGRFLEKGLKSDKVRKRVSLERRPITKTSLKMIHFKLIFKLGKIRIVISNY